MSAEFWAMGGYALYVWGSYAAGAAVLLWNVRSARRRHREVLERLRAGEPRA